MRELLAPYGIDAISAGELGLPSRTKTGTSFRDNARIKAEAAAQATGLPAFADDSGLAVDALDGAPGIHSARWAGPDKDFGRAMEPIEVMLHERGATAPEKRTAHFVSALCVAWPDGHVEEFEARVDGTLVWPPRGDLGFGYDPMFLPDGHTRTFGEMSSEEKHGLPPRGRRPVASRPRLPQARGGVPWARLADQDRPLTSRSDTAFGVYVHWPFCLSKCPYCDFNSHVRHAPIDEARFVRAFAAEIATTAARAPGRTVIDDLLRRRHAVADAAGNGRRDPRRHRQALERRARCRGDARSQSDQRRGDALSRLSRGRRQPRLARRAGARRSRAEGARPPAHRRRRRSTRSASRASIFERYSFDLIYARPRQTPQDVGGRAQARHRRSRRASVALSADHRAGHAVRRAARGRQARSCPTRTRRARSTT